MLFSNGKSANVLPSVTKPLVRVVGILAVVALLCCLPFLSRRKLGAELKLFRRSVAPSAASKNFAIHVFDVGQGDSQLIVYPSGYTILIDVCELGWNSDKGAQAIAKKIEDITGGKHVDVGVLSHLHLDHIGTATYGGFWSLIEEEGIVFDKIVDRDAGTWNGKSQNGECDQGDIDWKYAGTTSGTAESWLCYITNPANSVSKIREVAQLCSTTQITPPDGKVTIVTTDALGCKDKRGQMVAADHTDDPLPPSENDYSIGLRVEFGDLVYGTFGDLDGAYDTSSFGYEYNDVETVTAPRVGEVDIYHVNHHGSSHSSNQHFIDTLKPTIGICSCGTNNSYGHPDQKVIDRINAVGTLYITEKGNAFNDYGDAVIANSDIVVRSGDGKSFTVEAGGHQKTYPVKSGKAKVDCSQ